jgi:hypothetical protein
MAGASETAEIVAMGRALIANWRAAAQRPEMHVVKGRRQEQFAIVNGLAAHAHRSAAVAFDLVERDLIFEAMPIVRCVYEFALTAHWAAQTPDGAEALLNETFRQRTYTSHLMSKSTVCCVTALRRSPARTPRTYRLALHRVARSSSRGAMTSHQGVPTQPSTTAS